MNAHISLFYCHLAGVTSHGKVITDSSNPVFQNVKARITPASSLLKNFSLNTLHQVCWNFHFSVMDGTNWGFDTGGWAVS